jgi:hypothetical protein
MLRSARAVTLRPLWTTASGIASCATCVSQHRNIIDMATQLAIELNLCFCTKH